MPNVCWGSTTSCVQKWVVADPCDPCMYIGKATSNLREETKVSFYIG